MTLMKSQQEEISTKLEMVEVAINNLKEEAAKPMKTHGGFKYNPHSNWETRIHQ